MGVEKNITMKQFNGTDYDTLYPKTNVEQVENLTPSSIGAVAKTGGTMTGPLTISKSDYPDLNLKNTGSGSATKIRNSAHRTQIMSQEDENNYRSLTLNDKSVTTDVGSILQIQQIDGGAQTAVYKVLHTGNLSNLGVARIATGSYTGTGTYGSDKPNRLTLPFEPKFLYISTATGFSIHTQNNTSHVLLNTLFWQEGTNSTEEWDDVVYISRSGNTISWYSSDNRSQLNDSGTEYYYIAIG